MVSESKKIEDKLLSPISESQNVKEEKVEIQKNSVTSEIVEQMNIKEEKDLREAPLPTIELTTSLPSTTNKEFLQETSTTSTTEQQKEVSTISSEHHSNQLVVVSVPLQSSSPLHPSSVSIPLHSSPSPRPCSDIVKELTKSELCSPTVSPLTTPPPSPTHSNQPTQSPNNSKRIDAINNLWRDIQMTVQSEDERSFQVHRILCLSHIPILKILCLFRKLN
jgi:hypothetical protein